MRGISKMLHLCTYFFQARNYDLKKDYAVWHYMAERFLEVTGFHTLLRNVDVVYDKRQTKEGRI